MKKNKLLVLSLLACTLLASCDEEDLLINGSNPVGNVDAVDKNNSDVSLDTVLTLQDLYDSLKTSQGGTKAIEVLLEKIAELEYVDTTKTEKVTLKTFASEKFDVKSYRTQEALIKEISEKFEDVVEGTSYLDDNGEFDAEEYKDYIEETFDYELEEVSATPSKYLDAKLSKQLVYNYDEYIEEEIIPGLLQEYIYADYVTASSKYKGQFSNQYAMKLEVLKVARDTTKENGNWSTSLVKDLRAVTARSLKANAAKEISFSNDYSFVTFNSDNDMIIFTSTANQLMYNVYDNNADITALVESMFTLQSGEKNIYQVTLEEANQLVKTKALDANSSKSWTIGQNTFAGQEYYENIEELLVARDLWKIDREVVLARNYDYKTPKYDAMTETEKSEAKSFASTYSSSNSKPLREVAKEKKIAAQQVSYYEEPEYYNKNTYTSVLPSALSSLRGTSAKDLRSNLIDDRFLYPKKTTVNDPVYLDTDSNYYYVCEVSEWYGLYLNENLLDSSSSYKSVSNYHIEAYQAGELKIYGDSADYSKATETYNFASNPEKFESVIELVQVSAANIITDAMRKEAIVALFEKYGLEINEQIVHDYVKGQYPDYFEDEEEEKK